MPEEFTIEDALESIPEPEAPAPEAEGDALDPIEEALASAVPEAPAEETPAPAPAKPNPLAPVAAEDDFSDDRPWTPERVKAAAQQIHTQKSQAEELSTKAHAIYEQALGMAKKAQRRVDSFQAERDAVRAQAQMLQGAVLAIRQGGPAERIAAISQLTGTDGVKWLEELNIELAGGQARAKAPVSPELQELRSTVQTLVQHIQGERQAKEEEAQAAQLEAQITQWQDAITDAVVTAATPAGTLAFPVSAQVAKKMPSRYKAAILAVKHQEFQRRGFPIDDREAVSILESSLTAERDLYHSDGTTGSGPGGGQAPVNQKPGMTPSAPIAPTLSPSLSTASGGGTRPLSDSEIVDAIARELPPELQSLFEY